MINYFNIYIYNYESYCFSIKISLLIINQFKKLIHNNNLNNDLITYK
jgi:hypothetical protein